MNVSKEEVIAALRGAAFKVTAKGDSGYGRTLIHCFIGLTGADWDLDAAIALVQRSSDVTWGTHFAEHDLKVVADGDLHWFHVKRPASKAPEHLTVATSDRGFNRLPAIPSECGGDVRVYESSAAMGPHVWLTATAPVNLNERDGPTHEVPIHLTAGNASKLADQLHFLVEHHYQGTEE